MSEKINITIYGPGCSLGRELTRLVEQVARKVKISIEITRNCDFETKPGFAQPTWLPSDISPPLKERISEEPKVAGFSMLPQLQSCLLAGGFCGG